MFFPKINVFYTTKDETICLVHQFYKRLLVLFAQSHGSGATQPVCTIRLNMLAALNMRPGPLVSCLRIDKSFQNLYHSTSSFFPTASRISSRQFS